MAGSEVRGRETTSTYIPHNFYDILDDFVGIVYSKYIITHYSFTSKYFSRRFETVETTVPNHNWRLSSQLPTPNQSIVALTKSTGQAGTANYQV